MVIELECIGPHLEAVADDWSNGVNHGSKWPLKIFAAKYRAVEGSWRVVDLGLDVTGGIGIFRRAGYKRLIRDARLGRIHPANSFLTHEVVAKTALGCRHSTEIPKISPRSAGALVIEEKEEVWCARRDSNSRPIAPEAIALSN